MKTFEIRNGTSPDATVIGRVCALDETEAISTLQSYMRGFGVTDPGPAVPNAYVEWAHPELKQLSPHSVQVWRAYPQ